MHSTAIRSTWECLKIKPKCPFQFTKSFFDSAEVEDDFNLANNSCMKVLSSFNIETT